MPTTFHGRASRRSPGFPRGERARAGAGGTRGTAEPHPVLRAPPPGAREGAPTPRSRGQVSVTRGRNAPTSPRTVGALRQIARKQRESPATRVAPETVFDRDTGVPRTGQSQGRVRKPRGTRALPVCPRLPLYPKTQHPKPGRRFRHSSLVPLLWGRVGFWYMGLQRVHSAGLHLRPVRCRSCGCGPA